MRKSKNQYQQTYAPKRSTVKREELDRQPFKNLDSASNNLQVERKHVQVDINVRQNPRRKRSSRRPANRTSESVLKKRSVKDELYSSDDEENNAPAR